jgi:sphinganine-1-phosphate aldolase
MAQNESENENIDPFKPYKGRFEDHHSLPAQGRDKEDIIEELSVMAEEENAKWQTGQISGTFYHAGEDHRAFLNKVFSLFSHENTIQFDMCPSMFKMESEILSMTAKMLNGDAVKDHNPEDQVCGTVTSGGTGSILMAKGLP